jgi:hypothetical protein
MPVYFVELGDVSVDFPAMPEPELPARIRETSAWGLRAFPQVMGLRRGASRVS